MHPSPELHLLSSLHGSFIHIGVSLFTSCYIFQSKDLELATAKNRDDAVFTDKRGGYVLWRCGEVWGKDSVGLS